MSTFSTEVDVIRESGQGVVNRSLLQGTQRTLGTVPKPTTRPFPASFFARVHVDPSCFKKR